MNAIENKFSLPTDELDKLDRVRESIDYPTRFSRLTKYARAHPFLISMAAVGLGVGAGLIFRRGD